MDEPNIVKLNQQRKIKRRDRTELNQKQKYRTELRNKQNIGAGKLKEPKQKTTQNSRQHEQIEEEERKEKRMLMKMEEWLDDHATRRMDAPR